MAHEWSAFLSSADEWIVDYSLPVVPLTSVKLFAVGHALELYLKAANAKLSGSVEDAVKFGHNLHALWFDCKARDTGFLPMYELRPAVLERDLLNHESYCRLDANDLGHFLENQELYVVTKYLPDLKYLGAPLKKIAGAYALGFVHPNPKWAELFRALRLYLGHPETGRADTIRHYTEAGVVSGASLQFLQTVIE